jgi:hypothetical protein
VAVAKLMEIAQASDPKRAIQHNVGDLSKVMVFSGACWSASTSRRRKHLAGSSARTRTCARTYIQGQVGLVLKKGEMAFKDDDATKFHGQDVQVGEWVVFRPGDAKRIQLNGVDCRIVEDTTIDMVVENPEIVTHRQG